MTDKAVLQEKNLSDPNAFFTALVAKPYKNRVVLSPHLYGPSLSNNTYNIGVPQWKTYANSWCVALRAGGLVRVLTAGVVRQECSWGIEEYPLV